MYRVYLGKTKMSANCLVNAENTQKYNYDFFKFPEKGM